MVFFFRRIIVLKLFILIINIILFNFIKSLFLNKLNFYTGSNFISA